MEDITDGVYMHAKRVCKDFEIKHLIEYHDFHLKNDTLFFTEAFEDFREMPLNICHLDPEKVLSAPGLICQGALKKADLKLELLTDIEMLLMVEKGVRQGIFREIH